MFCMPTFEDWQKPLHVLPLRVVLFAESDRGIYTVVLQKVETTYDSQIAMRTRVSMQAGVEGPYTRVATYVYKFVCMFLHV